MALFKCPECGKEISDKATSCIHCGFPLTPKLKNVIRRHRDGSIVLEASNVSLADTLGSRKDRKYNCGGKL